LVLDYLADARAFLHQDQVLAPELVERHLPARESVAGGTTRITSSRKKGSNTTPRWRGAAPTMPSSSSRSATCSITRFVSEIDSATLNSGFVRWNSPSSTGTTVPPGPVEAPSASSPRS